MIRRVLKVQSMYRNQRQSCDVIAGRELDDTAILRYPYDAPVQSDVVVWAKT